MSSSPNHNPKQAGHTKRIEELDPDELLEWIQKKLPGLLTGKNLEKFKEASIRGHAFVNYGCGLEFFKLCDLPAAISYELAVLAREIAEGKTSGTKSELLSFIPCRQSAYSVTGDSEQAGFAEQSDAASKRLPRSEIDAEIDTELRKLAKLRKLAERACERRDHIREKFTTIGQLPDDADQLPDAVVQLSNPAFHTKLPFPFVGAAVPGRFNIGSDSGANWFYTGRKKFVELLDGLRDVRDSLDRSALWVYGTKGYGKSHLLAALACYLTAQGERVVYIPDCRECLKDPVPYVRAAMLFAWADNKAMQDKIITLDTRKKIQHFFEHYTDAILFIDQVNACEGMEWEDQETRNWKGEIKRWLDSCRAQHTTILSTSANYRSYLETATKESTEKTIYVYGGFTKVSLSIIVFANWITLLTVT
jgi:hypothetical protein